jgi:16S rRNA U1498 N3-methylase RsmE
VQPADAPAPPIKAEPLRLSASVLAELSGLADAIERARDAARAAAEQARRDYTPTLAHRVGAH